MYSGENRFTFSTFMLTCIIIGLETFVSNPYHYSKEKISYESDNFRPIAAHCIGYPIVSIGLRKWFPTPKLINFLRLLCQTLFGLFNAYTKTKRSGSEK